MQTSAEPALFFQNPDAHADTRLSLAVLHVYVAPAAAFVSVVQAADTQLNADHTHLNQPLPCTDPNTSVRPANTLMDTPTTAE